MLTASSGALGIKADDITALFPMGVSACVASDAMHEAPLFAAEWDAVAKARAARRGEFAAGRASARQALTALGGPAVALPVGPGRAPVWPEGFVGSITHTDDFCAAVTARVGDAASLGLDAESADPLDPEVERLVCGPDDYPHPVSGMGLGGVAWSKVIFSIKEAFYKCQYPLTRRFLDFDAAAVSFSPRQTPQGGAFRVSPRRSATETAPWPHCSGHWRIAEGLVLVGVWIDGSGQAERAG